MSRAACLIGFSTAVQIALQIADPTEWSSAQPRQHARHADKIRGPMCNIICLLQNYRSTWLMSRVTRYSCSSLQRTMACTSLRIAINSLFMWKRPTTSAGRHTSYSRVGPKSGPYSGFVFSRGSFVLLILIMLQQGAAGVGDARVDVSSVRASGTTSQVVKRDS